MVYPVHSPLSELRAALADLRISYHRALAQRLGDSVPPDSVLRRLIAAERDEDVVRSRVAQESRATPRWGGISQVKTWFFRLCGWR